MFQKLKKIDIFDTMRKFFLFITIINTFSNFKGNLKLLILFCAVMLILIINDYLRFNEHFKSEKVCIGSYLFSIIIAMFLTVVYGGFMFIYFLMNIAEPLYNYRDNEKKLSIVNFIAFILSMILIYLIALEGDFTAAVIYLKNEILELIMMTFWYLSVLGSTYFMRAQADEKRKVRILNEELIQANNKLQEYSKKVEELTIKNERNRVGQEIHDTLGHSITALIMQLDFIDKVMEDNPQKAKEILNKSQVLARESMEELRKAVYTLKLEKSDKLIESINSLIDNVKSTEDINVDFDYSKDVERLSPDIKNIIFRTIQESFTNGIKYGNSKKFKVYLHIEDNRLQIIIQDYGKGCNEIIQNNGMKGIVNRMNKIGGKVNFISNEGRGFRTEAYIPLHIQE